jgi:hypothetical protein
MPLGLTHRPSPTPLLAAGALALAAAAAAILGPRIARLLAPPNVRVADPEGPPTIDSSGRVRSVQAAELEIDPAELAVLLSPAGLDRLANTYLRFLSRTTLGLIRVVQTPASQLVVLLARPAVLLAFDPPGLTLLDADHGRITWPIRGGLLAAPAPRADAAGLLRIEAGRLRPTPANPATLRVEVAVFDYRPTLASRFGPAIYAATQARIHVILTHAFMRSLARMRLAQPPA